MPQRSQERRETLPSCERTADEAEFATKRYLLCQLRRGASGWSRSRPQGRPGLWKPSRPGQRRSGMRMSTDRGGAITAMQASLTSTSVDCTRSAFTGKAEYGPAAEWRVLAGKVGKPHVGSQAAPWSNACLHAGGEQPVAHRSARYVRVCMGYAKLEWLASKLQLAAPEPWIEEDHDRKQLQPAEDHAEGQQPLCQIGQG